MQMTHKGTEDKGEMPKKGPRKKKVMIWRLPVTVEASLYCFGMYDKLCGTPMLCFSRVALTLGENIDKNRS